MELIATKIEESLDALTMERAKERRIDKDWNHASSVGWLEDCERYLCLLRLCPEKEEVSGIERQRVFDEGHIQEPAMRAELKAAGWKLLERKKEPFFHEPLKLTGEEDDILEINGTKRPVDYKSCSDGTFREIKRCETSIDLMKSRFIWVRHYPAQMYSYLFGHKVPIGLLAFKNKSSGEKKMLDVPENKIYFNMLKDGLMSVNQRVDKEDPPRAVWKDACEKCGFVRTVCFTDREISDYAALTDLTGEMNQDLIILFSEWFRTEKDAKIHDRADKEIKRKLRGATVIVGGEWLFQTSKYNVTGHDLPEDIQVQIDALKKPYETTVERMRATLKWLKAPLKI